MDEELKQYLDIDYMDILYEDESVSIVEVLVMHEGLNRNQCDIPHDAIVAALPSLANKPIWAIPNKTYLKSYSDDFVEHARDDEQNKEIMIFGVFPESGIRNAKFVEKDDKIYLKVQAILFKKYSPIAMNILKKRDGNCKISIEIKAKGNTIQGILYVKEMIFDAAVALGADILEGIEGSSMDVIRFSYDEKTIQDFNDKYLKFASEEKFKIPKEVKENAQKGLDLRKEFGRGGTSVGINMARYIVKNEYATYEKAKKISQYFPRHAKDNLDEKDPPSNGWIAWLLWGSDEGWKWSKEIVDRKEKEGEKQVENSLEVFVAKDELGSRGAIKINTKKDAMSESAWGDEDKSQLKKDCLMASNWETICESVFLKLEEGWKEGKEGSLGYPVMEKNGDELVYNRYALGSAKTYAEKNNETGVLSKLKAIYKHLDLGWDDEEVKNSKKEVEKLEDSNITFSLNSSQIFDVFNNAISGVKYMNGDYECRKYYTEAYDENHVYLCDCEEGKTFKFPYVMENNIAAIDFENKTEVIRGGYVDVGSGETDEGKPEDWKNKYDELDNKYNMIEASLMEYKNKLSTYERKDEEEKMMNYIQEFAHCMTEDEMKQFTDSIPNSTYSELQNAVDKKAIDFAKSKKEVSPEEETVIKNSYQTSKSNFGIFDHYNYDSKNKPNDLESITKNSGVKIKIN